MTRRQIYDGQRPGRHVPTTIIPAGAASTSAGTVWRSRAGRWREVVPPCLVGGQTITPCRIGASAAAGPTTVSYAPAAARPARAASSQLRRLAPGLAQEVWLPLTNRDRAAIARRPDLGADGSAPAWLRWPCPRCAR
ncbi:unnamed protein product [Urochloa humidicola]